MLPGAHSRLANDTRNRRQIRHEKVIWERSERARKRFCDGTRQFLAPWYLLCLIREVIEIRLEANLVKKLYESRSEVNFYTPHPKCKAKLLMQHSVGDVTFTLNGLFATKTEATEVGILMGYAGGWGNENHKLQAACETARP
ncbi:unnamed protein product, partial [Iphiclides podalirius]